MLDKQIKNLSIVTLTDPEKANGDDFIINKKDKTKKNRKRRQKEKCENCKRCFGFCDFLSTSWKLFKEFSADTSIHGIKYLTDKQRHWTEKLFWAVALTLSIMACAYFIYTTLIRYLRSPLILTFSPKAMNIWEIPFAAITICPTGGINPLNENYNLEAELIERPLHNYTGNIDMRITNPRWRNDLVKANDIFSEIITEEGHCYTFNILHFDDLFNENVVFEGYENLKGPRSRLPANQWELENGYNEVRNPFAYPHRVASAGENGGLQFEIWRSIDEVKASRNFTKGFKLSVHLPCEIAQFDKQYYRFPLEKTATLIVRPSMVITEDLQYYSSATRQCYFEGEKQLSFFKNYTRSNCLLECLANHTRETCGCIHFSMPRLRGDKMCDLSKESCFESAKKNLTLKNMIESLKTSSNYDDLGTVACSCLPPCTSLNYEAEISQDDIRYFNRRDRPLNAFRSIVSILFKDDEFFFIRRSELYSWGDFIANFGGILGLFMGISILSIVEIIYFISFRQLNEESRTPSISNVSTKSAPSKNDDEENFSYKEY